MRNTLALSLVVFFASTAAAQTTPVVAAGTGQTRTLADVARERKLGKVGVKGGTLSVAGAPVPYLAASAATREANAFQEAWIKRNADTRGELAAARAALEKAQGLVPHYIASGRGSSATQAILDATRAAALLPYTAREAEARAEVAALPEAARKAGALPGWVRGETVKADVRLSAADLQRQLDNTYRPPVD